MSYTPQPLAPFLTTPSRLGGEVSVTGRWVPTKASGIFRKSAESAQMRQEWADIHADAKADPGVLSTEINHAVGADAVLVHHIFKNEEALTNYFATTASRHAETLTGVAKPELHLVRGLSLSSEVRESISGKGVPAAFGEYLFGYVKDDYRQPDPTKAIQVTAKWTCKPGETSHLEELKYWWQRVGTDAHSMEKGLVRFEVYKVAGEDALIIHETFDDTDELKFHLSKGTAEKYKKDIDQIASPEVYFFRGPVSWTIRTYSKFLHLPATYTSRGLEFTQAGGTMTEGTFA
jgi:quinol monooxygenase YgiN